MKNKTTDNYIGFVLGSIMATVILCWILNPVRASQVEYNKEQFAPSKPIKKLEVFYVLPQRFSDERSKACLIRNIFYEAPRYYPGKGKDNGMTEAELKFEIWQERVKIINVTHNRLNSGKFPDSLCKVIYQHAQFSWTLEGDKPSTPISIRYKDNDIELQNLSDIADLVDAAYITGFQDLTNGALYYHTHDIDPYWADSKEYITASRWHIFYKDEG